ncbi:hypothetical protein GCM10011532_23070 [Christiangramia forsetii]|nr:hypothetical protein GCM10011532_23070 [Christiangramia forsetii]
MNYHLGLRDSLRKTPILAKPLSLETLFRNITENGNWVLKINTLFAIFFLLVTLGFVFAILYLRISKIIKDRNVEKQKEVLSNFITLYLFDDKLPSEKEILEFRKENIKTSLDEKVAIKVLLVFEENFKGETNEKIKELFFKWDLSKIVETDLKSGKWYRVARAIYVASELNLKRFQTVIEEFIDSERDELRQQAILYFIHLSHEEPLAFFSKIKKPLTLWEQIYIEECLKSNYTGTVPDFSKWLNSELISIKVFSIKMIGDYNQYKNVPQLIPFLKSSHEDLKKGAIQSLGNLGYPELLPHLHASFHEETPAVKTFILNVVRKIGSIDDFLGFEKLISEKDWVSRQVYFKLWNNWRKELEISTV